ncbi:MFS transporter [Nocardioides insulae]|uniref:MFS transporter n=1 Tax=Nocardioides insulae TaxID=394734 RepID=UPI0003F7A261|nr:MFS transporter [Nocardioides insulae]
MYLTLRDRPTRGDASAAPAGARPRVARLVLVLGTVSLLTDVSSESVAAIMPIYLTAVVGLSPVAYGVVEGLYQGVSAVVRIAAGWAADRWHRPMPVALAGYGISALARVGLLFAGGFGSISAVLSADRVGKGIRTAPRDAMIAASSPSAHLGRAFGVHRALDTTGAALGPLLAFVILWQITDGYRTVLVVSLGFALLGVAALALFVPWRAGARAARDAVPTPAQPRPRVRWRAASTPGLRRTVLVAGGLALVTVGDGFVYLALLENSGFAAAWFPMLYVGTNVVFLALAIPVGRLADRIGRAKVLVLGHLPLAGAYLCAAGGSGGMIATAGVLLLLGLFYAATDGVLPAVAERVVPATARATGIAMAQTAVAVARLAAASGFGVLWYAVGPRDALLVVAAVLVLALPVGVRVLRRTDLPA